MAQISEKQAHFLNTLAAFQLECGRPTAALPFLHLSSSLYPDERDTYYLLANAYFVIGDTEKGLHYFEKYEEFAFEGEPFRVLMIKSIAAVRRGKLDEAKSIFLNALKTLG